MSSLAALLPLLCLFLIYALARRGADSRNAILRAAVIWGAGLTLMTEALSIFHHLSRAWLSGSWALVSLTLILSLLRKNRSPRPRSEPRPETMKKPKTWPLVAGVALIALVTGVIAVVAPPNTYDSMTYHMPRVAHWAQDQSLDPYPTHILRQLYQSPWAEYAVLHAQILAGSDRFANVVQWLASIGCAIGVSLISQRLGADGRGQAFAAFFAATLPMGIIQASSTQNDYVLAFWLICMANFILEYRSSPHRLISPAIGASLGLAIMTKPTAFLFSFPLLIWFCALCIKREGLAAWRHLLLLALIPLTLASGQYSRNIKLFGHPLTTPEIQGMTNNQDHSARAIMSNVARNMTLHLETPSWAMNRIVERAVIAFHDIIKMDPSDPATTYMNTRYEVRKAGFREDDTGNPLHFLLALLAMGIAAAAPRRNSDLLIVSACVASGFLLFCALLKWQPFASRLHLPLFLLMAPAVAALVSKRPRALAALAAVLFAGCLPWLLFLQARPLIGQKNIFTTDRMEQYFANRPYLYDSYMAAAEFVVKTGCRDVGLILHDDDYEYPFWAILQRRLGGVRIEQVDVNNVSSRFAAPEFESCALMRVYLTGGVEVISRPR